MKKQIYRQNALCLLKLISCVLNDCIPEKELIEKINLNELFEIAKAHSLTAITAYALESAGISDKEFEEEKKRAIRKNLILDIRSVLI